MSSLAPLLGKLIISMVLLLAEILANYVTGLQLFTPGMTSVERFPNHCVI